jgi:hypothetical protein
MALDDGHGRHVVRREPFLDDGQVSRRLRLLGAGIGKHDEIDRHATIA